MAGQIINLGVNPWGVSNDTAYQPDPGILIDSSLVDGGGVAYFRHYAHLGSGNAQMYTDAAATGGSPIGLGPDLTSAWETANEAITFTEEGGSSLILKGPGHPDNDFSDATESYFWTPDNRTAHSDWITNLGNGAVTMILWDGVGTKPGAIPPPTDVLTLADFDQSGLQVDMLALIEAGLDITGDNRTYYADSNRPPVTGSLLDGEIGVSATETLVSRLQYIFQGSNIGQIRLTDDDDPVAFHWGNYFDGDGADLTLYVQTADSLVSVPVASNIVSEGGGFVRISIPTADGRAVLNGIEDGDRFILGLARSLSARIRADATTGVPNASAAVRATPPSPPPPVLAEQVAASTATGVPVATATVRSVTPGDSADTRRTSRTLITDGILSTDNVLALLIPQWQESAPMTTLMREKLNIVRDLLIDPLGEIERMPDIDEAVNVYVDYLGERVGRRRPAITGSAADYPVFGFHGSDGVGFGLGRFRSSNPLLGPRVPLGDAGYKKLLLLRAGAITEPTTIPRMNHVVRRAFPDAYYVDGDGEITLHVGESGTLVDLVTELGLWPRPVGVSVQVM